MADNIKIIGEILNTQQVSRYDEADINLLSPQLLKENFGQQNDYIEYFVYDAGNNLLNIDYSYKDFKLPSTSYVDPISGTLPIIEIDPVKDLQDLGYSSGEFIVQYNLFNNQVSDYSQAGLFLKEISSDRTEIRVGSTVLTNEEIENAATSLINTYTGSVYFVDYLINFGNNEQVVAVNIALNKVDSGYEILFKLYQPLPSTIEDKSTLWVVKEKVNPYIFDINLDKLIILAPGPQLRGPNFDIEISNQNNIATSYQTYDGLVNSLQNVSSSYQQLLSLITSQSIDINTDYTDFNNFIFFSSAKQRVINFYNKVKEIEDYNNNIAIYTPLTSSRPNLIIDYNSATSSINNIISNFDGFEYYLYFESGSTLISSADFGVNPYPKSTPTKPFALQSTGSINVSSWYNGTIIKATNYDDYNQNNLAYTVPTFIQEDSDNTPYITFLNMVGHYFDNIWIYLQAVTDINLANNNLEQGISKDLVYTVLQSLGTKLYNKYGDSENDTFLVGQNSGSINFDNNFTPTGSYLNNIPRKDLLAETYKRIYHNLPLLLKTKGTTYGLQTLISTFGITGSILSVKEYGGDLKGNMLDEYNSDKIRIATNAIASGSVLSPFISLQTYPSQSTQFRTNDLHYVDISFSPETQIDNYTSASISSTNPSWSIDDYIGDPGYIYSGSYDTLNIERNTYYDFSPEYMDYAGFIRLIQFFDSSLFKMIKDFVPARANISTGITISSPVLERNKWSYANPSSTSEIEVNEGTIDGPTIDTEYTDLYDYLAGSKMPYYDGQLSGSVIEYGDEWIEKNFNPYLHPTASLTSSLNTFNHSEFNVLLNNVSASRLSNTRQDIEYIFGTTGSILSPAYLQDSNESLKSYQLSRYEGVKVSSLLYNTYTSASSTYSGDNSYGKTTSIDKQVRQLGLFTEIISSSFLPKRNRVALKYLVDEYGGLTELNQRNKHWEDVQRTFIATDYTNISQFDNQKFGNQKTTDGNKLIFDSGYSYYPIIYFATCSDDPKIYFENLLGSNSYTARANNTITLGTISGSGVPDYPVSAADGNIYKIFDTVTEGGAYLSTSTNSTFPTYTVQESGDHRVEASLSINVGMPQGGSSTWTLKVIKNGSTVVASDSATINISNSATSSLTFTNFHLLGNSSITPNETITSIKPVLINGTEVAAGTQFYKWSKPFYIDKTGCTLSNLYNIAYSRTTTGPTLNGIADPSCPSPQIYDYSILGQLYVIPNFETPAGNVPYTFTINRPLSNPINVTQNDTLVLAFSQSFLSTANYTASFTSAGSLLISSLSVATGYASVNCSPSYFNTASILASANDTGSDHLITFNTGISNFHNNNYQFVPNPLTGSQNSLYPVYGDVDYPFIIKPYDIALTYLSDGTYVESRILSSSKSGSFLQIQLDTSLSNTYRSNLISSSYKSFLILTRVEDETNANLIFKKREGKTSYGFVIPQNIAPDVLANIDMITKEVKQKLLADQQGTTTQ